MNNVQTLSAKTFDALKAQFGYTNTMQAPRVMKVVISAGTGKIKDKNRIAVVENRLARITGQKTAPRGAKKSIAAFKVRQGDVVGYQVTLRGKRMYDFLEKLIHIAFPRTRDFRGLKASAIDDMGNMTIGIKENTIFPETTDEDLRDVFGFAITVVSTAKNKKEAEVFYRHLGFPLQ
ncbi:MAG: 50S ribosomal protein L5 [Patescibacteria group bacterium]